MRIASTATPKIQNELASSHERSGYPILRFTIHGTPGRLALSYLPVHPAR
jgi:hypothetical protein